jgi:DNA (cytosine-5)-methyltransferase 1
MGAGDYKIKVPLNQALFGFGDAVCVPVIRWIARHYLNPVLEEMRQGTVVAPLPQKPVRYKGPRTSAKRTK